MVELSQRHYTLTIACVQQIYLQIIVETAKQCVTIHVRGLRSVPLITLNRKSKMDNNVIITIAQAIIANTKVLQSLVDSLPKEVQAQVAAQPQVTAPVSLQSVVKAEVVAAPVAAPAPVAAVPELVIPVFMPAVAAPVAAVTSGFASKEEMTAFIMDTYKALGPIKGAGIQAVLNSVGAKNLNEIKPEHYATVKAGVEALKV
jgi:hypothetical protein